LVRDIQLVDELSGLLILNLPLALSLAITLFSLAGIPPLAGFDAKLLNSYTPLTAEIYPSISMT
jgi:NADH-ubiquinone oxidoreductase chain 2